MSRSKRDYSGSLGTFWGAHSVRDEHSQPGNPKTGSEKKLPSEHTSISPEKAKIMLKEGTARGHALTKKQKGFLGAVAGKGE